MILSIYVALRCTPGKLQSGVLSGLHTRDRGTGGSTEEFVKLSRLEEFNSSVDLYIPQ